MKNKKLIIAIILAAVIVLGGIAAGIFIAKEKSDKSEDGDTTTLPAETEIVVVAKEDTTDSNELKCEYAYYYVNIHQSVYNTSIQYEMYGTGLGVSYTGYDCNKLPENQKYPYDDYKLDDGSTPTWKQYFEYTALRSVKEIHILEDLAAKDGFTISSSVLDEAYATIDQLKTQVSENEKNKSFESWLKETYGNNMTESLLKDFIRRQTIASEYATVLYEKLYEQALTDNEALETEYNKNPDLYNCVDFRIFAIYDSTSAGKSTANEMLGKITDEESFKKLAAEYATAEQKEKADYTLSETTLMKYVGKDDYKSVFGEDAVNWLFNKNAKVGDKKVFAYDGAYFVFYMVKPTYRDDTTIPVDVRHILYMFDENAKDHEADNAAKKAEAEATLNAINKSSDKLSTFLDYCEKDSGDTGSASNGGLIEYITRGVYVKEFEEWSLDPNRKAGDVGVIKTSYGYHVMYFEKSHPAPMWRINIAYNLSGDLYTKLVDDTITTDKYTMLTAGTLGTLNQELYTSIINSYYSNLS